MSDLTSIYTRKVEKFYGARGYVPGYHNIRQHREAMDEIINENNMSIKEAFIELTKIYENPEKMLYEIYYDLFGSLIYQKIERKDFEKLNYKDKALLVFKKIPGFMRNRFFLYHFGFLAVHFGDKKTIEMLEHYKPIDKDCLSIIKSYIF